MTDLVEVLADVVEALANLVEVSAGVVENLANMVEALASLVDASANLAEASANLAEALADVVESLDKIVIVSRFHVKWARFKPLLARQRHKTGPMRPRHVQGSPFCSHGVGRVGDGLLSHPRQAAAPTRIG